MTTRRLGTDKLTTDWTKTMKNERTTHKVQLALSLLGQNDYTPASSFLGQRDSEQALSPLGQNDLLKPPMCSSEHGQNDLNPRPEGEAGGRALEAPVSGSSSCGRKEKGNENLQKGTCHC
mgnify:CR=1 FL=1